MAVTADTFHTLIVQAMQGNIKYEATSGDTIKCALFSSAPSLTTAAFSSLTGEITGTGYTAGGVALSSLTVTQTEANSWPDTAATSTGYSAGQVVIPAVANGYVYKCVVAGTSGGTAPTWPTVVDETVADGTVTWQCAGTSITAFSSGNPSWTSATFTADYAVFYDSTTGYNIAMVDFGTSESVTSGTFTIQPPSGTGWVVAFLGN